MDKTQWIETNHYADEADTVSVKGEAEVNWATSGIIWAILALAFEVAQLRTDVVSVLKDIKGEMINLRPR